MKGVENEDNEGVRSLKKCISARFEDIEARFIGMFFRFSVKYKLKF